MNAYNALSDHTIYLFAVITGRQNSSSKKPLKHKHKSLSSEDDTDSEDIKRAASRRKAAAGVR